MKINSYGIISLSDDEIFNLIYTEKNKNLETIYSDQETVKKFNQSKNLNKDSFNGPNVYQEPKIDIETFDKTNQLTWFIPREYENLNIKEWLVNQCTSEEELSRVKEELELFDQYKMIDVLKFLKYLVDTLRKNKIVWGVGRGSSVSSYILFLIGVHRINSLRYNLDIKEFLK